MDTIINLSDAIEQISSTRGKTSVLRNTLFGAIGGLRAHVTRLEGMTKAVTVLRERGFQQRADGIINSSKFKDTEAKIEAAAAKAAAIHGVADQYGIMPEFEPGLPKDTDPELKARLVVLAKKRGKSDLEIQQSLTKRNTNAMKRYAAETEAASMAEAFFWSAEGADFEDIEVRGESVLRALNQTADFIESWSVPDEGELELLCSDIKLVEKLIAEAEQRGEPSEGSLDEQMGVTA